MDQLDSGMFRDVMGRFPTGVTVVTTRTSDGTPRGLTVNAFTSVSLDPPLVLVCIDKGAATHDPLAESDGFAVSILSEGQAEVARRFASDPAAGRFETVGWTESEGGNPVLEHATAWLDCTLEKVVDAGDHSVLLGRVARGGASDLAPLVWVSGTFGRSST